MNKITQKIKILVALLVFSLALTGTTEMVFAGSADNSLSSLTLSEGSLSPSFEGSRLQYTATVGADTTSVEVNAKPVNSAASVISVTGNTDLAVGTNKIQVVVQAENGNLATYTITVTRPESGASSESQQEQPQQEEPQQEQPRQEPVASEEENPSAETTGNMVSDEAAYTISDDFKEDEIPESFSEISVTYQGEDHKGLLCDYAEITLVYMTNEAGEGAFFIYDASSEDTYPFIQLSTENSSIILMRHTAPGEEYTQAELTFGNFTYDSAYQQEQGEFYQVYAVNNAGVAGWYQYDASEGTYQRYMQTNAVEEQTDTGKEYLQQALNDLDEKYVARRDRDMKIIAVLIVVCVILLFVILNLLLRARRKNQEEEDELFEDDWENEQSDEAVSIQEMSESETQDDMDLELNLDIDKGMDWNSESETAKETVDDLKQGEAPSTEKVEDEWEEDKEFTEFEEDPQMLSVRKAKRERKKKERREKHEKVRDIFDDDDSQSSIFTKEKIYSGQDSDDELEVMDLNDL